MKSVTTLESNPAHQHVRASPNASPDQRVMRTLVGAAGAATTFRMVPAE